MTIRIQHNGPCGDNIAVEVHILVSCSPLCHFDDCRPTYNYTRLTCRSEMKNGKHRFANELTTVSLFLHQQIADNWIQFNSGATLSRRWATTCDVHRMRRQSAKWLWHNLSSLQFCRFAPGIHELLACNFMVTTRGSQHLAACRFGLIVEDHCSQVKLNSTVCDLPLRAKRQSYWTICKTLFAAWSTH